jgi:molybdate transport system substrate-binding protein
MKSIPAVWILTHCILVLLTSPLFAEKLHPPWQQPPSGGVSFTVDGINNVPDLHGEVENPDLVVFFGGNQFMALPEIMEAFRLQHPQYMRIFYETLPPGIIEEQMKSGSLVIGNLKITHRPDLFVAGEERLQRLHKERNIFMNIIPLYKNRLAIMVHEGNPKNIQTLKDLGRENVAVAMPNPETEGIAEKAMEAFRKAGGEELVKTIMERKVERGTTLITRIHHRQTPMRIMERKSDAGPVWYTEAVFQQNIGNPIGMVKIPDEENVVSTTAAAILKNAPHPEAADDFLRFLSGEKAAKIYKKYEFMPLAQK